MSKPPGTLRYSELSAKSKKFFLFNLSLLIPAGLPTVFSRKETNEVAQLTSTAGAFSAKLLSS